MPEPAAVAVLAKAPVPGYAKTRLVPHLGAAGAAALQGRLMVHALATACSAGLGPVTLWCAPDCGHPAFREAAERFGIVRAAQPEGDLGRRMLAAFAAAGGPLVLLGTDCPVLTVMDLRRAAAALEAGADVAVAPAADGGYGLVAARRPLPALFEAMPWSTDRVWAETRHRAGRAGLRLAELPGVWDVDTPADHDRLVRERLLAGLGGEERNTIGAGDQFRTPDRPKGSMLPGGNT